jgi:hypothetical protein
MVESRVFNKVSLQAVEFSNGISVVGQHWVVGDYSTLADFIQ